MIGGVFLIIKRIAKKIKDNKGIDVTIEEMFWMFIWFFILYFIIIIFGILLQIHQVNFFANELVRTAELYGEVGEETNIRYEELEETFGISPTVEWSKTGKLDFNEEISVLVTLKNNLKIASIKIPYKIPMKSSGTSEVYRK